MNRPEHLSSGRIAVFSPSGDFAFLTAEEFDAISADQGSPVLGAARLAELCAKHIVNTGQVGMSRLLEARRAARRETVESGVSLHILVPTLQCAHSCQYCQVSRALDSPGFEMSEAMLDTACDTIFESKSPVLTVEFQGGDPLIRFDLVRRAIERIARRNAVERRRIQFVVASTLHQLDLEMCAFFRDHSVVLSTSIDGPPSLHNKNRPVPGRYSHERTITGIAMAREHIAPGCVSALMTTTKASLAMPEAVVDEYVRLGFDEIFVRPMASHGFAKRNEAHLGYFLGAYFAFYERCLERVLWWNKQGVPLRESAAAIWLNKLLSPFDSGYVDLQSPTGAGSAVLVYNYDGHVYPSDEARMLAETGDVTLRLGRIGEPLDRLRGSEVVQRLRAESDGELRSECAECAFHVFCGPDPVEAIAAGRTQAVALSDHCQRSTWLFRHLLERLDQAEVHHDEVFLDLAYAWARRDHPRQRVESSPNAHVDGVRRFVDVNPEQVSETRFRGIPVRAYLAAFES